MRASLDRDTRIRIALDYPNPGVRNWVGVVVYVVHKKCAVPAAVGPFKAHNTWSPSNNV